MLTFRTTQLRAAVRTMAIAPKKTLRSRSQQAFACTEIGQCGQFSQWPGFQQIHTHVRSIPMVDEQRHHVHTLSEGYVCSCPAGHYFHRLSSHDSK